jgi:hypothetical protein
LDALGDEIALRHRITNEPDTPPPPPEDLHEPPTHGTLPAASPDCRDRHAGSRGAEHGPSGPEEGVIGAGRQGAAREVHDLLVAEIAVGEHHGVDGVLANERVERLFRLDRDPGRITRPGQLGWVSGAPRCPGSGRP